MTKKIFKSLLLLVALVYGTSITSAQTNSSDLINLAFEKPTEQSSTNFGGAANRAVDGNTNGRYRSGSTTHTANRTAPWWQVDLGQSYEIQNIDLYNRTDDCCTARLNDVYVFVSDEPFARQTIAQLLRNEAVETHFHSGVVGETLSVDYSLITGRYVRVQLQGTEALSLTEVEVFGREINEQNFDIEFSTSQNRANLTELSGASVSDDIFVVVNPASEIDQVLYYVNNIELSGQPTQTENNAPFDLQGTRRGLPNPFDTSTLNDGENTVSVRVLFNDGSVETGSVAFNVNNDVANAPTPEEPTIPVAPVIPEQGDFTVPDSPTAAEASAFLQSASFGPSLDSINQLVSTGYSDWFRAQQSLRIDTILSDTNPNFADRSNSNWETVPRQVWYERAVNGPDQLRQRAAFALSQILVASTEPRDWLFKSHLHARYMDIMQEGAFGNFRDLLEEVTYSGMMGEWLTYIGNEKADPETGALPDENYAREIMQLFTIGLIELNQDGSPRDNPPQETYSAEDVSQLSRVFTGLWWADRPFGRDTRSGNTREAERNVDIQRMVMHDDYHSMESKSFLGQTIPANTRGDASISQALDVVFNHPNTAPFIGKQLIQRLTTSNPAGAYVERVANAFDSGSFVLPDGGRVGSGDRGDMAAVFAAIIFDPEAHNPERFTSETYGKVREPLIRFLHWARATDISRVRVQGENNFRNGATDNTLGQTPFRSDTVFNFFRPGFVAGGTVTASRNLVAPELQIISSTTAITYPNFMALHILRDSGANWLASYDDQMDVANDTDDLIEHLDLVMTRGRMTDRTKQAIADAVNEVAPNNNNARRNRIQMAMLMVVNSQEFSTQ